MMAAFFFLFLAAVGNVSAQGTISNCVDVICPPQVVTNYTCDDIYIPTTYPIIVSNNCPGTTVQVQCNPPPGTPLPVGAHPIHCIVLANGAIVANCDFWIIVERDITPPTIKCPSNIVVNACPTPTGCGAFVTYPAPMASDNSGSVSVVCVPPSGSFFPCGTTPVICTATDRCGLKDVCEFTVTVNPNGTPPQIQCPADITVETCSNSAVVTFSPFVSPAGTLVICNPPSGSSFPIGTTSVLCIASNGCGQIECTFKVTVRGAQPPTIICPTNLPVLTLPCGSNCIPVVYPLPTVLNGTLESCNPPPGTCLPAGIFTVICRATNICGQVAVCSFDIRILQGQGQIPTIICPSNVVVTAPCASNCVPVNYPLPTVLNGVFQGCTPPPGTCFPVGITAVTCFASNQCGRVTCSFTVRVLPGQGLPPSILCPSNIVVDTCRPNCDVVNYPLPIVNNGVLLGCTPPSGSCFPIGTTAVTCTAGNACATNSCTFFVTVRPVPPASIICPSNTIIVTAPCGVPCVPVTYALPPVLNGGLVGCTPPPGTCLPVGIYNIVCTATNRCGLTNTCSFKLEVRPGQGQPPIISCPTNTLIFRVPCNSNCVPINYLLPPVINGVLVGCTPPPGTCLPVGSYTVVCTASNICSTVECAFQIEVIPLDPVPPQIICPSNIVVTAPCGVACVPVNYPLPTVFNGALAGCVPPPGTCFPIGITTVTCRATNNCDLIAECKFDVIVVQGTGAGQLPVINCPSNIIVNVPCTSTTNCVPVFYPLPVVVNGVLVGCTPPPGTCLPIGLHVVTCIATNECGKSACEFTIRVQSVAQPPSIICPSNRIVTLPCGSNCVPVFYPPPTVLNGTLVSCTPPSGTCLPVGIYVVSCFATNVCGLSAKCEFQIRVIQGQGLPPIINCPTNIVAVAPCGSNCVPVFYPPPTVLNGALEGCSVPPGFCFPIGTNIVFCRATNACGPSVCSFNVIVVRGQGPLPTIKCPSNAIVQMPCGSNCVPISYPLPTVSGGVLVGCTPAPGTCLPLGNYIVLCRATNECGEVRCEFPLFVVGGQGHPPIITCPSNITVEVCTTNCTPVLYPLPTVVNGVLVGCNPPPTFCFPIGSTPVTCLASNSCGTDTCTFIVTVRQRPFPQIICPSNITVTTCSNSAVVTYSPTILGNTNGVTVFCNPPSGSSFPIGTTVVTCCVIDQCQRINCCEFTVTVKPGKPCVNPPPGMVLWLPFDELVPPTANNIVPGAPNGGHVGGVLPVAGQYVLNSLRFDGINDFVRVPNYAAIILNNSDFSIDAWVRRDIPDQGRRVIVSKLSANAAGNIRGYEYYLNNGVMNLLLGGGFVQNFNSGVAVPPDNNWHHVAVTVRRAVGGGGQVRFYLDGALVNLQVGPITAPLGNNSSLFVGAGTAPAPNSFFRGGIDEVEIFNRALTPAEVMALWSAQQSGKCKITCHIPWDVPLKPGTCITVMARICNNTPFPQPVTWSAVGPVITTPQSGSVIVQPFSCTNIPVVLCAPATLPPNSLQIWTLYVWTGTQCPISCMGSVIITPVMVGGPIDPTGVPGTNVGTVRVNIMGLPPTSPLRISAIGPDMMPDMQYVSLNGLPPGVPWLIPGISIVGTNTTKAGEGLDIPFQFMEGEPVNPYVILIEADLDGDGDFEPLASFDVENPVVPPSVIRIENGQLWWEDMGGGLGHLEAANSVDGPWTAIPGGPGTPINPTEPMKFFRVAVPTE
jgi:hypothetical protein